MWDPNLTPEQLERLDLLVEECAEVIQIAQKIKRFGWDSFNPADPYQFTNSILLHQEIGDLEAIMGLMINEGELGPQEIQRAVNKKLLKLPKFTRFQKDAVERFVKGTSE